MLRASNNLRIIFAILAISFPAFSSGESCGGLLEGDGGQLEFPIDDYTDSGSEICIWVVKLLSRSTVSFTLDKLTPGSSVSLYREHNTSETTLIPTMLASGDFGRTISSPGTTLIVVLASHSGSRQFSFTWDSLSSSSPSAVVATNYVDTDEGRVLWSRFSGRERLTWVMSLGLGQFAGFEAETQLQYCKLIDPCKCLYFAVYEVTPNGDAREVTRVCGRSHRFETEDLFSQLIVFVYVDNEGGVGAEDSVEIKWHPVASIPTPDPEFPGTTDSSGGEDEQSSLAPTTAPPSSLGCGGVFPIEAAYTVVDYKLGREYSNNEKCVWFLDTSLFNYQVLQVDLVQSEFEEPFDGLQVYTWNRTSIATKRLGKSGDQVSEINSKLVLLYFSSDEIVPGRGFRVQISATYLGKGVEAEVKEYASSASSTEGYYRSQNFKSFFLNRENGLFSYPQVSGTNYPNDDKVAILIQPQYKPDVNILDVSFNYLDTEKNWDFLSIYTLRQFTYLANAVLHGPFSGSFSSWNNLTTSRDDPRLLIFTSDGSNTARGFQFRWSERSANNPGSSTPDSSGGGDDESSLPPNTDLTLATTERENEESSIRPTSAPPRPLQCGGIISIDSPYTVLDYKLNTEYSDNEKCVWFLNPADHLQVRQVQLVQHQFEECCDGLKVYTLNGASVVTQKLQSIGTSVNNINSKLVLLQFSSDRSVRGRGFEVKVSARNRGNGHSYYSSTTEDYFQYRNETFFLQKGNYGHFAYPQRSGTNYPDNDFAAIVVQPESRLDDVLVKFNYLETERNCDYLSIYILPRFNNAFLHGQYSGSHSASNSLTTIGTDPRLFIFTSDSSNTAKGFEFEWSENLAVSDSASSTSESSAGGEEGSSAFPNTESPASTTDRENVGEESSSISSTAVPKLSLDCGGIISINDLYTVLHYKLHTPYSEYEKCVWVLNPADHLQIRQVQLIQHGFETYRDGLQVYTWNGTSVVTHRLLESGDFVSNIVSELILLHFSSDYMVQDRGFRIEVSARVMNKGYASSSPTSTDDYHYQTQNFKSFFLKHDVGHFSYPSIPGNDYPNNDKVAIVVQPETKSDIESLSVYFTYLKTEKNYDLLRIYSLLQFAHGADALLHGTFSGTYSASNNLTTHEGDPRLLIFTSDGSTTDKGFEFEWYTSFFQGSTTPDYSTDSTDWSVAKGPASGINHLKKLKEKGSKVKGQSQPNL